MKITKRNGVKEEFNPNKILTRIKKASKGLKVDADQLYIKVVQGMASEMSSKSIDGLMARTAAGMAISHPDYAKVASNVSVSRLHKETYGDFLKTVKELYYKGIISETLKNKAKQYSEEISKAIDYSRDYNFNYFGWSTLEEVYLLKFENVIYERPQDMYMRVALHLHDDISEVLAYYELVSTQKISPATPILLNSGTKNGSLISCNLTYNIGDTSEGLLQTFTNICKASSASEGIGLAMHNIRSKDTFVGGGSGKAGGLLKYAKVVNEGMRFWNQMGKRPGACAIYIEPWHRDIFDVLDIRKNTGIDEERARDLFLALWIPNNFMKAVKEDTDYYLFCPNDIQKAGLKAFDTIYDVEFEQEYAKAVTLGIGKQIKAKELWVRILDAQMETGVPYMLYKDHVNNKSAQKNIGTVKSSNLCAEVIQYSDKDTTAQCVLSSLPLQKYLVKGKFDYKALEISINVIVRSLNKVIDTNKYSSKQGKKGAEEQRALAIGVQGFADLLAELDLPFTSDGAKKINKEVFEAIYYFALKASNEMAKENNNVYKYFKGSPASEGILQWGMWGLTSSDLSGMWDWDSLIESIKEHGLLNSLLTAEMPTASSANVIGSNEAFEPYTFNMYTRKTKAGEFVIINPHMVRDLEREGMWNESMRNEIVLNNGSVQNIPVLEQHFKDKYKTAYELSQKELLSMSRDRAPFVDQTQSMNIFMASPTIGKLTSSHFYAWEQGLKTGMYYLRSQPINMRAQHLGVDLTKQLEVDNSNKSSEFECFGCSA